MSFAAAADSKVRCSHKDAPATLATSRGMAPKGTFDAGAGYIFQRASVMSRPRIRTLKPEFWADEKVGHLSRDARLLLVGLITMADDEGRLRGLPIGITGHVFPYDADAPKKLEGWLAEVLATGVIVAYVEANTPYLAFRHWRRHQKVSKAQPSQLPAPPDPVIVANNSLSPTESLPNSSRNVPGKIREEGGSVPALTRGPARSRIGTDRNGTDLQQGGAQPNSPFVEGSCWGDETVANATNRGAA